MDVSGGMESAHALLRAAITERAVIDILPRAVVVTDAAGVIMMWNSAAEGLYGWPEAAVVGRSVVDVLAPLQDLAQNVHDLSVVASGVSVSGDRFVKHRDGHSVRVSTFTQSIVGASGEVVAIVGLSEDVGDLRVAEQEARDLASHFQLALQAGGLGTWRWHMASGVTLWDDRLEALFGLPPGGFDGTFDTYVSLLHPDDRERVLQAVHNAVATRSSYRLDHRIVWPDGSVRWLIGTGDVVVDEQGNVSGTVGCSIDVTERVIQELDRKRHADLAIEIAEGERVQRQRFEFLNEVNDALNSSTTVQDIMANVTRAAVPRLGDWCSIHIVATNSNDAPHVEIAHTDPRMIDFARKLRDRFPYDPDATSGVPYVIRTGQTLFLPELTEQVISAIHPTVEQRQVLEELDLRSVIVVPLTKRGRVLGAMQFVMSQSSRRYTDDDVTLAQSVAGRIAASLENRRLDEEQRQIAHTLQRSLLPSSLPDIAGVEIAVRYWPTGEATEVGGDFYDVFALDTIDRWAIVIGDVCGTGTAAAALTGLARHSIRDSAWHGDSTVEVLTSLNRAVHRSGADSFLTAVYAVLDTSANQTALTLACGGHPLPIHTSSSGTAQIGKPGTLLGVINDVHFEPVVTVLAAGDSVVFYTDGATDLRSPHALTPKQFAGLVAQATTPGATADTIAEQIRAALETILPLERRNDDIALLVLRVTDGA